MEKSEETSVKIFIPYHKPSAFVDNPIFQPIKVGANNNDYLAKNTIFDNNQDNISNLNPKFCELTAQYWAWKNSNYDYYGFFHYRRYLSFNTSKTFPTDAWGSVIEECPNEKVIKQYKLDKDSIEQLVKKYDIILPQKRNVSTMPEKSRNIAEQYTSSGFLHKEDLEIMKDVIKERYPEYVPCMKNYLNGKETYLNNMFIMKKEIFDHYCSWLFDILFECEKRIDYQDYSTEAIRTPGHLAERLLNIYILKQSRDNPNLKIKELQTLFFSNTEPIPELKPAFTKNNIAIALSTNDYYIPYVSTLMTSIIFNSSTEYNYDIIIMHKDVSVQNQERLKRSISHKKNFSLRFINVINTTARFENLFLRGHFTIETWFRLMMPDLLQNYNKILYLDSDLIALTDIAELFQTNIDNYLLAACHDADTAGLYNGYSPNKKEYMDKVLKLSNPYNYFQAGVVLYNLKKFRNTYTTEEVLKLASSRNWQLLDQDVLNILAKDNIKYIDMSWNVMFDWNFIRKKDIISLAPEYLSKEYNQAHARPKIIHYAGPDKPWDNPDADYADLFWEYARKSNYYETILLRTTQQKQTKTLKKYVKEHLINKALPKNTLRRQKATKLYQRLKK